jgi:hypothetical protein
MAAKKTVRAKTSRKTKPRAKVLQYKCPNPGEPMSLTTIVRKIMREPGFARFIRDLLCQSHRGNAEATKCLNSYFNPKAGELEALCYPPRLKAMFMKCTEQNLMLDVVAYFSAVKTSH